MPPSWGRRHGSTGRPRRAWLRRIGTWRWRRGCITGSRASSTYGEKASTDLASDVALREWTVVTGGGYGCESSATRGALDAGGQCVAVLASGVDVPYPRSNEALLDKIEAGEIDPSFVVTTRASLEDAPKMYQKFRDKQDGVIKVVLRPGD